MSSWLLRMTFAGIVLSVTAIGGCLGEPIPKRVVAGTTFTLPYSGGVFGVASGQRSGNLLATDPQRGNVRFALCTTSSCTTHRNLLVRYITRIFPDPGSPFGLSGNTEIVSGATSTVGSGTIVGEPVVMLDVPGTTPAGTYLLTAFVDPPGPAAELMNVLESIEIIAKPSGSADAFSDLSVLVGGGGAEVSPSLRGFIPSPQLGLALADGTNDRPAAGTLTVRYPSSVEILGAFEGGVLGQNSIVRFKTNTTDPMNKTVAISFVDPDKRMTQLVLAFSLTDPNNPVQASSFSIVAGSQALYTSDGVAMPITDVVANAGNSFAIRDIQ